MSKNYEFYRILLNQEQLKSKNKALRDKALDAIIQANPGNADQFRKALTEHHTFWNSFDGLMNPGNQPDYFKSVHFLDPAARNNFTVLQQLAAEQRVSLGLAHVSDEVLIKLLANNPDECRNYLNSKPAIPQLGDLTRAHGWSAPAANPPQANAVPGTLILTNEAIESIKNTASDLLILKCINKCTDSAALNSVLNARNRDELHIALNHDQFAYPAEANGAVRVLSNDIKNSLRNRLTTLNKEQIKNAFVTYINGLSEADSALEPKELIRNLKQPFADAFRQDTELAKWAEDKLGIKYLQLMLPKASNSKLLSLINSPDKTAFTNEITRIIGPQDYVTRVINDELMHDIKVSLAHQVIDTLIDKAPLIALINAQNLVAFKAELKKIGITASNWIKDTDVASCKAHARLGIFEAQVERHSRLGRVAHPELISAFKLFSVAQQEALIKDHSLRSKVLNSANPGLLINALPLVGSQLQQSHDATPELIDRIARENRELNLGFRALHNAGLAKALANYKPAIVLNKTKVDDINLLFETEINFNDADEYDDFLGAVATAAEIKTLNEFRDALSPARESIMRQHQLNQPILTAYYNPATSIDLELLDVFLRIQKTESVAVSFEQAVSQALSQANSWQDFVKACKPESIRTQIMNELSPEVFRDIKMRQRSDQLSGPDQAAALRAMNTDLVRIQKERIPITEEAYTLNFIKEVNPVVLISPGFLHQSRADFLALHQEYTELMKHNELIIDKLRRDDATLTSYQHSLAGLDSVEIRFLRENLAIERESLKVDLKHYEKVQEKFLGDKGILNLLQKASVGEFSYVYRPEGVDVLVTKEQSSPVPAFRASDATIARGNMPEQSKFSLDGTLAANQIRQFDITHAASQTVGRFIESHPEKKNSAPSVSKKGSAKKMPECVFEIKHFPSASATTPPEELAPARVNFSMTMALQILAKLDKPPTKENPIRLSGSKAEELKYLWTALVILGERNPKMTFGQDAIQVVSRTFKPESEMQSLLVTKRFKSDSLYKKEFNSGKDIVANIIEDSTTLSKNRINSLAVADKADSAMMQANKDFKSAMKDTLAQAKDNKEREGPAPESAPDNTNRFGV